MSVILSVFILGSIVDFIQTWNELHNMLMTLPSFGSPVWVLDVRLYATFNMQHSTHLGGEFWV